nr:MAG TPA: hypothetical protein [Caudoviricetes sp.]
MQKLKRVSNPTKRYDQPRGASRLGSFPKIKLLSQS